MFTQYYLYKYFYKHSFGIVCVKGLNMGHLVAVEDKPKTYSVNPDLRGCIVSKMTELIGTEFYISVLTKDNRYKYDFIKKLKTKPSYLSRAISGIMFIDFKNIKEYHIKDFE